MNDQSGSGNKVKSRARVSCRKTTVIVIRGRPGGKSMLKAEGKGKDGISYRAELTKKPWL